MKKAAFVFKILKRMTRITLLSFLILISTSASGQSSNQNDEIKYYKKELGKLHQATFKSVTESEYYQSLKDTLIKLVKKSDDYMAFSLVYDNYSTNFTSLNAAIRGYHPYHGKLSGVGYGVAGKWNRNYLDLHMSLGFYRNSSSPKEDKLRLNYTELRVSYGYDLIKSMRWGLYPAFGLAYGISYLKYSWQDPTINNNSQFLDLIERSQNFSLSKNVLRARFSFMFDYSITNPESLAGLIIFIKYGQSLAIVQSPYRSDGLEYDYNGDFGKNFLQIGVRIFGKEIN